MNVLKPLIGRFALLIAASGVIAGCVAGESGKTQKLLLLAPFEGRDRAVGYEALYAARLALADLPTSVQLFPIDDGGSLESALLRARAAVLDPQIMGALILGVSSASPDVQIALGNIPAIIIGSWMGNEVAQTAPARDGVFFLNAPQAQAAYTVSPLTSHSETARKTDIVIGGEWLALPGFLRLRQTTSLEMEAIYIVSAAGDDPVFEAAYRDSDPFAPEPALLAILTYDAATIMVEAINSPNSSRAGVENALRRTDHAGLSGQIAFVEGVWQAAPVRIWQWQNDDLVLTTLALDDIVEER